MTSLNKLSVQWTASVREDKAKADLEVTIRNSTTALTRLREIVTQKLEAVSDKETRIDGYDTGAWAYRQAHFNGSKQALKEVLELLSFLP